MLWTSGETIAERKKELSASTLPEKQRQEQEHVQIFVQGMFTGQARGKTHVGQTANFKLNPQISLELLRCEYSPEVTQSASGLRFQGQ
jgi:hypothetical protein